MTCKQPLYAVTAALLAIAPAAPAWSQPPPCGACVRPSARPEQWPGTGAESVALVVRPGEVIGSSAGARKSARTIVLDLSQVEPLADRASFTARRALADLRGMNGTAQLGVLADGSMLEALLAGGLAAYADFVVAPVLSDGMAERWTRTNPGLRVWSTVDFRSFGELIAMSAALPAGVEAALIWPPAPFTAEQLGALHALAEVFPERLVPLPDYPAQCTPAGVCTVTAFQRADTLETVLLATRQATGRAAITFAAPRAEPYAVAEGAGADRPPAVADTFVPLAPVLAADARGRIELWLPAAGVSHLAVRIPPAEAPIAEDIDVVGARQLTADEIVARHQAATARQQRIVQRLITHAHTTLTFEVPAFPAPVTIQAETTMFQGEGTVEIAQRNVTVNGVAFTSGGVPRLPLIEPERAAAPPLAITLTRAYRYRLAGRERARARECYVIAFEPVRAGESLFAGRAWIDNRTFALVRVDAVQTALRGPITSSQQIEEFAPQAAEGDRAWLLTRSEIRQVYQGAGVTTPIHRLMIVRRHEVNPSDFRTRRLAALASDAIMLRETPQGLRYLQRPARGAGTRDEATPVREVAGRATRIRTLAGGVLIDPNITRPLPFAGVNYTDFDFLGTGTQLNAFFGGAYGQFAFNAPSIGGTRWQLSGSGFAMLARYNDRSFRAGRERYDENLRQRPAHFTAGLVRALTSRTAARAEYVFDYVALDRAESTAATFVVPADQVVHGARIAVETQRAGWRLEAWWNPARRAGWREWGAPGATDDQEAQGDFQRFGASAYRPWVLTPRLLARVEAAWMSGRDLDRFSRYAFGTFDNRLRGYPSAGIRYDRGGALRTALVWQAGGRIRLDGFADAALVRDPGFGRGHRTYPGVGAAVEVPGPLGLLLGAEWGYGIKGLNSDGSEGTHVVRVTAYKVF
ncbi:MAG TPA: hypothetical protein VK886_07840 [Vicinamibacterales bacterium]|nr:hypothetical protein [Vicinamibacterales bacterium]